MGRCINLVLWGEIQHIYVKDHIIINLKTLYNTNSFSGRLMVLVCRSGSKVKNPCLFLALFASTLAFHCSGFLEIDLLNFYNQYKQNKLFVGKDAVG